MRHRDNWILDMRGVVGMQTDAVRREAENDRDRILRHTLDEPKEYEKRLQTQTNKSARLRALRLAKEAQDQVAAAGKPALKPGPSRTAGR